MHHHDDVDVLTTCVRYVCGCGSTCGFTAAGDASDRASGLAIGVWCFRMCMRMCMQLCSSPVPPATAPITRRGATRGIILQSNVHFASNCAFCRQLVILHLNVHFAGEVFACIFQYIDVVVDNVIHGSSVAKIYMLEDIKWGFIFFVSS